MEDAFHIQCDDELFGEDWLQCYATPQQKADKLDVLLENQKMFDGTLGVYPHQADLLEVLLENQKMFDGTLGVYPHRKVHIEIDPNAKPKHSRAYPVPRIQLSTFKKELDHLVKIGVLAVQGESECAHLRSSHPRKMAEFAGSATCVNLIKLLSATNILCQ
jgi:hypothetical protein